MTRSIRRRSCSRSPGTPRSNQIQRSGTRRVRCTKRRARCADFRSNAFTYPVVADHACGLFVQIIFCQTCGRSKESHAPVRSPPQPTNSAIEQIKRIRRARKYHPIRTSVDQCMCCDLTLREHFCTVGGKKFQPQAIPDFCSHCLDIFSVHKCDPPVPL